jgi:C1A family cysteine protease
MPTWGKFKIFLPYEFHSQKLRRKDLDAAKFDFKNFSTTKIFSLKSINSLIDKKFSKNLMKDKFSWKHFGYKNSVLNISSLSLPIMVDWRVKGVISDVINQGYCGACWAHSVLETIASLQAVRTRKLEKLSVQQMLDCTNNTCSGGDTCSLLGWLYSNKISIELESDYPRENQKGTCKKLNKSSLKIKDYSCDR